MGNRIKTALSGVAFLFVAIGASHLAAVQADGPEQLVGRLQRSARDRDVEGFLSHLTAESRQILEASSDERDAQTEFEKAVDEKFGQGSDRIPNRENDADLRSDIGAISAIEVVSKKDIADGSVELRLRTTVNEADRSRAIEETVGARVEDGEWKLSLVSGERRPVKNEIERVTAEVRGGRFNDRVAAMIALDNALRTEVKR